MSCQKDQRVGRVAMGQGDLRRRCSPERGGYAGNNFEIDVRFAQRRNLFANTPKDERIAAFEPHYLQSRCSQSDHEKVDLLLADALFSAALANVAHLRAGRSQLEYLRADQVVMEYNIRVFQHAGGFEREQFRIAGSSAHEIDLACHTAAPLLLVLDSVASAASNASMLASDCSRSRLRSESRWLAKTFRRVSPSSATQWA